MTHRFTAVDLFCGCGGLTLGLRRAKFDVVAAVDNDVLCVDTYRQNHKRTYVVNDDIRLIDVDDLMRELDLQPGELDLLAGCPPCQGFSTLRTMNGSRDIADPLNDLALEFIRFITVFLPKTIMMENVPAFIDDDRMGAIQRTIDNLDYRHIVDVLNAEHFGVPQRRLRMILIASRYGTPFFAQPVRSRRTVAQAIQSLPSPCASIDPIHNYSVRRAEHVIDFIRRVPKDGGSRTDLPLEDQLPCHRRSDGFKDVYGRLAWRKPAPTITGGCINPSKGRYIHPEEDRAITLREAAGLQGFPKSYYFDMSQGRYATARMIGNAFPPKFAEHHGRAIHQLIQTQRPLLS